MSDSDSVAKLRAITARNSPDFDPDDEPTLVDHHQPPPRPEPESDFPASESQTLPGRVIRETVGPFTRLIRAVHSTPQAIVALALIGAAVYLARIWLLK